MQKQNVILIPPSDEQAYASFHIVRELVAAFIAHLADCGIDVRQPERVGRLGPQTQDVIEIEVLDDSLSISVLEEAVNSFFDTRNVENQ